MFVFLVGLIVGHMLAMIFAIPVMQNYAKLV